MLYIANSAELEFLINATFSDKNEFGSDNYFSSFRNFPPMTILWKGENCQEEVPKAIRLMETTIKTVIIIEKSTNFLLSVSISKSNWKKDFFQQKLYIIEKNDPSAIFSTVMKELTGRKRVPLFLKKFLKTNAKVDAEMIRQAYMAVEASEGGWDNLRFWNFMINKELELWVNIKNAYRNLESKASRVISKMQLLS